VLGIPVPLSTIRYFYERLHKKQVEQLICLLAASLFSDH